MRFVTFYFLICVQGKSITVQEAMFGIYLLLSLQKASRTLMEIAKQYSHFEEACFQITKFLSLEEIDFDTVDISYGKKVIQEGHKGLAWDEQSVKLGNDFQFQDEDSECDDISFASFKPTFSECSNYAHTIFSKTFGQA